MDSTSVTTMSSRAHTRSFQHLPNLPVAVIPKIDLGIQRTDLATMLQLRPNNSTFQKYGYGIQDKACQTDEEHIIDLKFAVEMLQTLTQDAGRLRRDLNFAQSVLKANYENKIYDRAAELYCRMTERITELENRHTMKTETVRKCYQAQLDNAIQKISGDYEAYYEDLLGGKTGRHDLVIKDLRQQLVDKDVVLRQLTLKVEELQENIQNLLEGQNKEDTPVPAITPEEVKKMEDEIEQLKRDVDILESDLATQFDKNEMLNRENTLLNKELDEERQKHAQIQKDMSAFKIKAKQDQERAARMAEQQLASLEKEMKDKVDNAEKDAARKAQEQAEIQRMQDQAKFKEETEKRKNMEDKLRAEADTHRKTPTTEVIADGELLQKLQSMELIEKKQKEEVDRLTRELEKTNKIWEIKMAVLRKNYLALKDEFYIRHNLQRQAASLHQASVGYVTTGSNLKLPSLQAKEFKPQHRGYMTDSDRTDTSSGTNQQATDSTKSLNNSRMYTSTPPPSPNHTTEPIASSKMVHFEADTSSTTYPNSNTTDSNRTDTTNASHDTQ